MARLTNADLNNAMKEFRQSKGNEEFLQYFPKKNWLKNFLGWRYYLLFRLYRRKVRKLWMSLPSL